MRCIFGENIIWVQPESIRHETMKGKQLSNYQHKQSDKKTILGICDQIFRIPTKTNEQKRQHLSDNTEVVFDSTAILD